jgi:hypothetical protein
MGLERGREDGNWDRSGGRRGLRTAAIFAWRLGGIRVAAGAFMFAIFDDGGRRTGAGVAGALIGDEDEPAAADVVSIEGREWAEEEQGGQGGQGRQGEPGELGGQVSATTKQWQAGLI